jgi:DNA-binding transcriptional ArsR family regulator
MVKGIFHFMKGKAPSLLPLLRTQFLGEALAWLYLHPDQEYSTADLATRFGVSAPTASREADRITNAGLAHERRRGNLRLLRADTEHALARPLTDLLALTYGPTTVLSTVLSPIATVDRAIIYGSWAARYRGVVGPVPNDVDVLVIGDVDEDDLYDAAREAERRLGRPVNANRVRGSAWDNATADPFLSGVIDRPTVDIELTGRTHEVASVTRCD